MPQKISSRQNQILKLLLENRNGLSIDDIADALDISRTAVQQHFAAIENEGYIKKNTLNKTAGRPVTVYVITDRGINYFPKQYAWFSELMLSDLQQEIGPERFKNYMRKLGVKCAEKLHRRFEGRELNEKIDELVMLMSDLGYQVQADAKIESDEFSIQAHNCVYHDLVQKHDEICEFDLALISTLLDQKVEQVACLAKGDCACTFKVRKPGSTAS
ncbi:HTH domain-containing protein [Methylomicrobium sp. Wu6]|uniref:helix-turn-helix transcriptional regulator n=1 Tax=Methylomicrobium sp. Wu6 TaxID=3107928 RepID=UPI002DD67807|nr:HTH domain-containing protein [Methylomicrobium sp. Wu6]MEC4748484.1 HTH domain-containing protein [Methylomicrobium sp. Wu6]